MKSAKLAVQIYQTSGEAREIAVPRKGGGHHLDGFDKGGFEIDKTLLRPAEFSEIIKLAFGFDDLCLGIGFAVRVCRRAFD